MMSKDFQQEMEIMDPTESVEEANSDFDSDSENSNFDQYKYKIGQKVLFYQSDNNSNLLYDGKIVNIIVTPPNIIVDPDEEASGYFVQFTQENELCTKIIPEDLILENNLQNNLLQQTLLCNPKTEVEQLKSQESIYEKCDAYLKHFDESYGIGSPPPFKADKGIHGSCFTINTKTLVELRVPESVRNFWEFNREEIQVNGKRLKRPASPSVIQILEDYVKHFAFKQLANWTYQQWRPQSMFQASSKSFLQRMITLNELNCQDLGIPIKNYFSDSIKNDKLPESLARLYGRLLIVQSSANFVQDLFDNYFNTNILYGEEEKLRIQSMGHYLTYVPSTKTDFTYYPIIYATSHGDQPIPKYNIYVQDYIEHLQNWSLLMDTATKMNVTISDKGESITSILTQPKPSLVVGIAHLMRIWDASVIPRDEINHVKHFLNDLMEFIIVNKYMLLPIWE